MRISVNGNAREVSAPLTVAELVRGLGAGGADGRGVAVAVDAQVVPRSQWAQVQVTEGQRVEVLGAIQGG